MNQEQHFGKKKFYILGFILIIVVLAVFFWRKAATTYSITVRTDTGINLYAALEQDGDFSLIGNTNATFTTSQVNPVHFRAIDGDKETRLTVLPKEADEKEFVLPLRDVVELRESLSDSLISPLLENNVVYGINPSTYSLATRGLDGFASPKRSFFNLPFMKKIIWDDSKNFAYQEFGGNVGLFVNDKNLGTSLNGKMLDGSTGAFTAVDIARSPGKPLVILGTHGIYTGAKIGAAIVQVATTEEQDMHFLGSDDKYVYYAGFEHPAHFATEGEGDTVTDTNDFPRVDTLVLDYSGKEIINTKTSVGTVFGMTYRDSQDELLILSDQGLASLDAGSEATDTTYVYSAAVTGMTKHGDFIYLFANDGIWVLNDSTNTFSLFAKYPENQTYVAGSAEKTNGESPVLRFSTKTIQDILGKNSDGVFEIPL